MSDAMIWNGCVVMWMLDKSTDPVDNDASDVTSDIDDGGVLTEHAGAADDEAYDDMAAPVDDAGIDADAEARALERVFSHVASERSSAGDSDPCECVLLMYGSNGLELKRPLPPGVYIIWAWVEGAQMLAVGADFTAYVWRSIDDKYNYYEFANVNAFEANGVCDCESANMLMRIVDDADYIYVLGVDECACAQAKSGLYEYLPQLPDDRYVLALNGVLLWDGYDVRAFDNRHEELCAIEPGVPTLAPTWAPGRHRHHHACVRALVLQLLVLARWAPGARLPAALWHRILERTADCSAADLRSFIRDK